MLRVTRFILLVLVLALTALGHSPTGAEGRLWVVSTDYQNPAEISAMEVQSPWSIDTDLAQICPDPVLREFDGLLYVIGRFGCGDIEVLDPADGFSLVQSFSVGADLNPQDIALISPTRGYVTRYDSNWVLEVDPSTGAVLDSLSLDVFADADGSAELSRMFYLDPYLYVQVQRLDRDQFFTPVGDSYLAVINAASGELVDVDPGTTEVDGILLTGTNPFGEMWLDVMTHELWVSEVGSFGIFDGGIDRVDLTRWMSTGYVTTETELNGDILDFAPYNTDRLFVLISDASFLTCVQVVSPATGLVDETLLCASGYDFADLVASADGLLYLADRASPNYGIRVFDAAGGDELTTMAIGTGLRKPVQLLLVEEDPAAIEQAGGAGTIFMTATPNPSSDRVEFRLGSSQIAQVDIVDALGRRVAELGRAPRVLWDGKNSRGEVVPPGVYWARARRVDGTLETLRVVRVP